MNYTAAVKSLKGKDWRTLNVVEDFVEEMLLTNANLKKIVTLLLAVNDVSNYNQK